MTTALDASQALEFVRTQGVVLVSAKGSAPRLIEAILGQPIKGNWWAHPQAKSVYRVLSEVVESEEILVCRLLKGKVTLVHCRRWAALVRVADKFDPSHLARVIEEHTPTGRHVTHEVQFPTWVPPRIQKAAKSLSEAVAFEILGPAVSAPDVALKAQRKASSRSRGRVVAPHGIRACGQDRTEPDPKTRGKQAMGADVKI